MAKPKDLSRPFSWEERCVLLEDGIFFVPDYLEQYDSFSFPGWEGIFGNTQPVHVEYCSGNGQWIVAKARNHPDQNWVAVEKRFDRVRKIWSKKKNEGLENLLVVCGEAGTVTQQYFPSASVAQAYVNFPDPWPKDRHAKHRLIQEGFVEQVARILTPEGIFTLVTDDERYSGQMVEVLCGAHAFSPKFPAPHFCNQLEGYGDSYFEQLWRSKGKQIRYHQFYRG